MIGILMITGYILAVLGTIYVGAMSLAFVATYIMKKLSKLD